LSTNVSARRHSAMVAFTRSRCPASMSRRWRSVRLPCITSAVYSRISAIDMPVARKRSIRSSQLTCSSP
jgi:hypothetical protein